MMIRSLPVAGILAATVLAAPARELVVDGSAPGAADNGPGTAAAPYRTIGAAAAAARPGDTVRVKAGIYRESVRLSRSGTAAPQRVI